MKLIKKINNLMLSIFQVAVRLNLLNRLKFA